ncbi:MAG: cytochrome-c peroxidase [Omnitrophica WOR_2 bacterium]
MKKHLALLINILMMLSILAGCKEKDPVETKWSATPYKLAIPRYFPTQLNIPDNNPMTIEGINLGRYLFYDGRLSGRTESDSLMSCSSCHVQVKNFRPGLDNPSFHYGIPQGISGIQTTNAALPLINLVWNQNGYTWNGSVGSQYDSGNLESIVIATIEHPAELAGDTAKTVALLQSIDGYPDLFYKAFGSKKITAVNISRAIAQFVRTLISANSRFDKYMRGELQLTTEELEGFILFTTEEGADCFHCHGSSGNPLFTTNLFYNNGKDSIFAPGNDRYSVTNDLNDIGAYKATTLRNIAVDGPYMHDGRFKTLDEVINFYSDHVIMSDYISPLMHHVNYGGIRLTPSEKSSLKAFLYSLVDEEFLSNPNYSAPSVFPDGKTYQQVKGKY